MTIQCELVYSDWGGKDREGWKDPCRPFLDAKTEVLSHNFPRSLKKAKDQCVEQKRVLVPSVNSEGPRFHWRSVGTQSALPTKQNQPLAPVVGPTGSNPGILPREQLFLLKNQEALVHKVIKGLHRKQNVSIHASNSPKQPCVQMVRTSFWAHCSQTDTQSRAAIQVQQC